MSPIASLKARVGETRHRASSRTELCPVTWVVDGVVGIVQRPLRDYPPHESQSWDGRRDQLTTEMKPLLEQWASELWQHGFRGVLCLSHPKVPV